MHSPRSQEASSSPGDSHRPGDGLERCKKTANYSRSPTSSSTCFITTDKNLRYQQNLARVKLALLVLPTNSVPVVIALLPQIEAALNTIQAGDFVEIPMP